MALTYKQFDKFATRTVVIGYLVLMAGLAGGILAQTPLTPQQVKQSQVPSDGALRIVAAPDCCKPNEVQMLRLQVKQRDAWLAQRDAIEAQRRYQQAIADLNALGEEVRKENGWPETVIFNPDRIEFSEPPAGTARPGTPTSGTSGRGK